MKQYEQTHGRTGLFDNRFAELSDEECVDRLAKGYRQSFDESCLVGWEEIDQRLARLFERKRAQRA